MNNNVTHAFNYLLDIVILLWLMVMRRGKLKPFEEIESGGEGGGDSWVVKILVCRVVFCFYSSLCLNDSLILAMWSMK